MNQHQLSDTITTFLTNRLSGESHFLVGVKVSPDLRRVTVLLDGDSGVDVEFCAKMSREIGEQLESLTELPAYVLEVSSSGADAPMKLLRQISQHKGRMLQIRHKAGSDDLKGELLEVQGEELILRAITTGFKKNKIIKPESESPITIPFNEIEYARVIIQM
jgi:ribosome maturation factor RimP